MRNQGALTRIAQCACVALFAVTAATASAAVTVIQPATADALARSSAEKRNFGFDKTLELKSSTFSGVSEAYLRFDFPGTAVFCDKVLMRLFAQLDGSGAAQVVVRSIADTNWSEKSLMWKWRPEHGTTLGSLQVVGVSGSWYELDVTEYVRSEIAAGRTSGNFVLVPGEGAKQPVQIRSREAEDHQPELIFSRPLLTAKISFLPRDRAVAPGYMADTGDAFGPRTKGFSYGWSKDNRPYMRDRSDSRYKKDTKNPPTKAADRRYETLAYMDNEKMTNRVSWEIALPAGSYRVKAVAGDAQRYDSIFGLTAEKARLVDGVPDRDKRWIEGTATVVVKDGRLTIENTASSSNNKLCFVEINEIAPTLITRKP